MNKYPKPEYEDLEKEVKILRSEINKLKKTGTGLIDYQNQILDSISQSVIVTDLDGKVIYWNEGAEKLYGWSREEALNMPVVDLTPTSATRAQAEKIIENLSKGDSWRGEFEVKKKSGEAFTAYVINAPLKDENGDLKGIIGLSEDVSEKNKTIETFRTMESYYKAIAMNLPKGAAFIFDKDFTYLYVEGRALGEAGLEKEDITGKKTDEVFPERVTKIILPYQYKIFEGEKVEYQMEYKGRIYHNYGSPISNTKNEIIAGIVIAVDVTNSVNYEKALLRAKKETEEVLNSISDAFFSLDEDLKVTYFNDAAEKLLGKTKSAVLGKNLFDVFSEAKGSVFEQKYKEALRKKEFISFEEYFGIVPYDNWYSVRVYPKEKGISVYFQVTTEQKEAEKALRESEEKYRLLANNATDIITLLNSEGLIEYTSPSVEYLLGFKPEDMIGMNNLALIHTDDRADVINFVEAVRINGKGRHEYRMIRKDGRAVWVESNMSLMRIDSGAVFLLVSRNIEDRKAAEKSLEREMFINKALVNISKEIIAPQLSIDRITSIVFEYAKKLTESFYGLVSTMEPKTGEIHFHKISPELSEIFNIDNNKISLSRLKDDTFSMFRESLNSIESFYVNTIKDDDKTGLNTEDVFIYNVLSVPAEVQGRQVGQIVLANKPNGYSDLDLKVIKELGTIYGIAIYRQESERELLDAKNKAEKSDKLKSAFLANMSHEIRTPMNAIIGFSQMLNDEDVTKEERIEFTGSISKSCSQLLAIIDDIIDISKIEAGYIEIKKSVFNLNEILKNLMLIYKAKTEAKGLTISLQCELNDTLCSIYTDPVRLKQIFTNLLDNALKFTKKGYIEFGYNIKDSYIEFFVRDTGIGIGREHKDVIFERFRQVEIALNRSAGGNGIGLSISKALTELLGGKIWVESKRGAGSVFYFTIPYKMGDMPETMKTLEDNNKDKTSLNGVKILVVEDDATNLLLFKRIFSKTEAEILYCKTGRESIEIARGNPDIDIVLMDIKLPDIDGYEATRQIKNIRKDLPVIAQTAYALSNEKENALKSGCDAYVSKPIIIADLFEKIKKLLSID